MRHLAPPSPSSLALTPATSVTLAGAVAWFASASLDLLAPPVCAACDRRLVGRAVFCRACALSVEPDADDGGGSLVAFATYGGPLADAIRRFKYDRRPELARPLGELLRAAARQARLEADLLVPVPLHARRLIERGYNQAALLAARVATDLRARVEPRGLERLHVTQPQAQLSRDARLVNLDRAFRVREPARVRGRCVVVVDDVATTGATLGACSEALLSAGAASVTGLVLARAVSAETGLGAGPEPGRARAP